MIPVQPVPTQVTIGQAQGPQGVSVVLTISDPTGTHAYFFPPVNAKAIGEQLVKAGEAGNIIIAQPGGVDLGAIKAATSAAPGPNRAERRAAEVAARREARKAA